jgi:hypothetical protein
LFKDTEISLNDIIFKTNRILFSCFCHKKVNSNSYPATIAIKVEQKDLSCFISFINLLKGFPINFNRLDLESVLSVSNTLDCSSVLPFIQTQIKIPTNLSEANEFLRKYCHSGLREHFEKSISILAKQLKEISFEILNSFSHEILEHIFSSRLLKVPNDDFLFELISLLTKNIPNKKT